MSVKQVLWRGAGCGMLALALAITLLAVGCEKAEGLLGLVLEPGAATLGEEDQTLLITVTGGVTNESLALPLEWRVSNPALGSIEITGRASAIYRRTGRHGMNTVTARDQYKNEGFCVIEQVAGLRPDDSDDPPAVYEIALNASPASPISEGGATTISINMVTGVKPPYTWELVSGPGTLSAGTGSSSAVYSSTTVGIGVIRVSDGNGVQGLISIVVEDPGDDDGPGGQ